MSIQHVNFFEIIPLNVEIFYAYEVRPTVTNILVRRDNVAWETYLFTKNESSISKHNVKVFRNSPCKTWITEKVQIEEFLRHPHKSDEITEVRYYIHSGSITSRKREPAHILTKQNIKYELQKTFGNFLGKRTEFVFY